MTQRNTKPIRAVVAALMVFSVVVAGLATPAAAGTQENAQFEPPELVPTIQQTNTVVPGETTTLTVGIQNVGSGITASANGFDQLSRAVGSDGTVPGAATGTVVEVQAADAPVTVKTGAQSAGTISPSRPATVPVTLEVAENATPGTYELPVRFSYEYVRLLSFDQRTGKYRAVTSDRTVTEHVTVRVEEDFRLEIVDVRGANLRNGEDGTVNVTVRNAGTEVASDTELRMQESPYVVPQTNGQYLGRLAPGETATAEFRASIRGIESAGEYAAGFRAHYEDENGVSQQSAVRTGKVAVDDETSFALEATSESLYVDSLGAVAVEVTNTGDTTAENARAVLHPEKPFVPVSTTASLGDLEPGESAVARFKVEVVDRAGAPSYPLTFTVDHDDAYGERVRSDEHTVSVDVGPEMTFDTGGDPTVAAGSTDTIEVTVTNTGDGTFTDAVARVNANTPFETDDDTAYVGTLEPGESATVRFTVSVDGKATAKDYSLDTSIKYKNEFGETVVTDTEQTAVTVTESGGGFLTALFELLG